MIQIAVCDDEEYYREYIKKMVGKICSSFDVACIIDTYGSGKDFCDDIQNMQKYHLIFLDIGMNEMDGMQVARQIRQYNTDVCIVFITVLANYVFDGYKVNAFRYLIKDSIEDGMRECMDAFFHNHKLSEVQLEFNFIGQKQKIVLNEIIYIESQLHKLCFYFDDTKFYLYEKLDAVEKILSEYSFVRIHKSFLVNLRYVTKISGYKVYLKNDQSLPAAKARYPQIKERYIYYKECEE